VSWLGLARGELDGASGEVATEVMPLPVEQDAAPVEYHFGSIAAAAHARAIEPKSHEVPDCTCSDIVLFAAQFGVALAVLVLGQVHHDVEQALAAALVA
jgi:hypothetical protein